MSDKIDELPQSNKTATPKEIQIMSALFKEKEIGKEVYSEFKEVLIVTIVFLILTIPWVSSMLKAVIPAANNGLILFMGRGIVFAIIYYILLRSFFRPKEKST